MNRNTARRAGVMLGAVALVGGAAACSSSSTASQQSGSTKQSITLAFSGVGPEETYTVKQIDAFEKAKHPARAA